MKLAWDASFLGLHAEPASASVRENWRERERETERQRDRERDFCRQLLVLRLCNQTWRDKVILSLCYPFISKLAFCRFCVLRSVLHGHSI